MSVALCGGCSHNGSGDGGHCGKMYRNVFLVDAGAQSNGWEPGEMIRLCQHKPTHPWGKEISVEVLSSSELPGFKHRGEERYQSDAGEGDPVRQWQLPILGELKSVVLFLW